MCTPVAAYDLERTEDKCKQAEGVQKVYGEKDARNKSLIKIANMVKHSCNPYKLSSTIKPDTHFKSQVLIISVILLALATYCESRKGNLLEIFISSNFEFI